MSVCPSCRTLISVSGARAQLKFIKDFRSAGVLHSENGAPGTSKSVRHAALQEVCFQPINFFNHECMCNCLSGKPSRVRGRWASYR